MRCGEIFLVNIYTYFNSDSYFDDLDAIENLAYFDNIEKVLSSIGLSISDAVMTFFNSGGVQNKDVCIIDRSIGIIIYIFFSLSRSSINVDIYVFDVKHFLSIKNLMKNIVKHYHYRY